jgi:hypothetical protein
MKDNKKSLSELVEKVRPIVTKQTVYGKGALSLAPNGNCVFKPGVCFTR